MMCGSHGADTDSDSDSDSAHDQDADTAGRAEQAHRRAEQADRTGRFMSLLPLRRRSALMGGAVAVAMSAELVLIAPYTRRAAGELAQAQLAWILPAVAGEMISMMMFARLQRHALGTGGLRVRLGSAAATVFAGNAVGATLPGGSLLSITYRTRRMRSWGASASQIGFAHAATGVLSTIALALFAGAGHILSGDSAQLLSVAVRVGATVPSPAPCSRWSAIPRCCVGPCVLCFTCCAGCAAAPGYRHRPTGCSTNWPPCTPRPGSGRGDSAWPCATGVAISRACSPYAMRSEHRPH